MTAIERIAKILRYIMWGVMILVFIAYYIAPTLASYFHENMAVEKMIMNSWNSFWSPTGLNAFLQTFLPLGLLTWFLGYIQTERSHKTLWHFGTLIKIVGYAVLIIVVFNYFFIPLSSVNITNADDVKNLFSQYFNTTYETIKFFGTFIAIAIVIVAGIEIQEHSEEKKREKPEFD